MPKHEFDANKFVENVLTEAERFATQLQTLQEQLEQIEQLSVAQRTVYQGLDVQIKNTLVDLSEAFENLESEMQHANSVDLKYHLTRIRTLSKEGLKDVNKAIDITAKTPILKEGAGIFDDIKRELTHFTQWVSKRLGQYEAHSIELKEALDKEAPDKKQGRFHLPQHKTHHEKLKKAQKDAGIKLGEKGHTVAHHHDRLLKSEKQHNKKK